MKRRFRYGDVSPYRQTPGVRKRHQSIGKGEKSWWIELPTFMLSVRWRRWGGLMPSELVRLGTPNSDNSFKFPNLWSVAMKKLSTGIASGEKLPPLSSESTVFKRFPRVREFMSAREYDDGTLRQPGRIWLDSDNLAYTATIFERSGFGRMRFRAQTLDDLWTVIEAFLSQETPQWEDDEFAREKAAEKTSKKKRAG